MTNTLITFEGKYGSSKRAAEILGYILGNTKLYSVEDAPKDLADYKNIIFIFGFYGPYTAAATKAYIKLVQNQLAGHKIGVVGVGIAEADFASYRPAIAECLGRAEDIAAFVEGELRLNRISPQDLKALEMFSKITGLVNEDKGNFSVQAVTSVAEQFIKVFNAPSAPMEKSKLKKEIERFIAGNNTLAMATGTGDFVRCTPIEYQYIEGCFYFITEGGMKFKSILQNKTVSMGIFDKYDNMSNVKGLQITGEAEIVPLMSEEYCKVLKQKDVNQSALKKMPINLYLLKITPRKFEFLNSDFKKTGFDSKQIYEVK